MFIRREPNHFVKMIGVFFSFKCLCVFECLYECIWENNEATRDTKYENRKITSMTGHLIHGGVLVVDLLSTFFVRWVGARRASHEDQLVVDDDECDICTSDYVDTCPENSATLSDRFCKWERIYNVNSEKNKRDVYNFRSQIEKR